jgi:hypothetical protein
MKYLKKFNESAIEDYLQGKSVQEFAPGETWYLLDDLSNYLTPSALTESDFPRIERLVKRYFKPELTGVEIKNKSIYSLGRLDPKDTMCKVNWKLNYPNKMIFDVTVIKYDDDYFFIKTDGLPVSGNTQLRPYQVIYPMKDSDINMEHGNWLIDGWDGLNDWVMSSPINESNNYDILKYKTRDYSNSRKVMIVGVKTNQYRTLMTQYNKIGRDDRGHDWYLFDEGGYHFGTIFGEGGNYFRHDGSVDEFGRRKS